MRIGHGSLPLSERKYLVQVDPFTLFQTIIMVCLTVLKNLLRGTLHLYTGGVHIILSQTFGRSNGARKLS
jgi:hypothetical protein